jgi:hypothetical protein
MIAGVERDKKRLGTPECDALRAAAISGMRPAEVEILPFRCS